MGNIMDARGCLDISVLAGGNMMASPCVSAAVQHSFTRSLASSAVRHERRNRKKEKEKIQAGVLLIIKLLKHAKHCFMLRSRYQKKCIILPRLQKISSHLQCWRAARL